MQTLLECKELFLENVDKQVWLNKNQIYIFVGFNVPNIHLNISFSTIDKVESCLLGFKR